MSFPLTNILQTLEVADSCRAGNLQIFGLGWAVPGGLTYLTLDEALTAGTLEITEVSEGGEVPHLKVMNAADTPVFLMAGEQLIGAKQNRVLNTSLLVPSRTGLAVPVSCVEARRWRYDSRKFASGGNTAHRRLRRLMNKQVLDNYRRTGQAASNQGEVWQEVDRKLKGMASVSGSAALHQAYEDHRKHLESYAEWLTVGKDWHGVVFAFNDRIAGMDLFDNPSTLTKLWPKLVRAYAIDALEEAAPAVGSVALPTVAEWLKAVTGATAASFKSPGLGDDVRFENERLVGSCLMVGAHPVHLEIHPNDVN
jgi:hypothetical protein